MVDLVAGYLQGCQHPLLGQQVTEVLEGFLNDSGIVEDIGSDDNIEAFRLVALALGQLINIENAIFDKIIGCELLFGLFREEGGQVGKGIFDLIVTNPLQDGTCGASGSGSEFQDANRPILLPVLNIGFDGLSRQLIHIFRHRIGSIDILRPVGLPLREKNGQGIDVCFQNIQNIFVTQKQKFKGPSPIGDSLLLQDLLVETIYIGFRQRTDTRIEPLSHLTNEPLFCYDLSPLTHQLTIFLHNLSP